MSDFQTSRTMLGGRLDVSVSFAAANRFKRHEHVVTLAAARSSKPTPDDRVVISARHGAVARWMG
jgi:hypothetical protein